MATFVTDLRVDLPCEAYISTTGGQVKVCAPFWCPPALEVNGVKEEFPLPTNAKHPFYFTNSQGLAFEAAEVRRCLKVKPNYWFLQNVFLSAWPSGVTQDVVEGYDDYCQGSTGDYESAQH